LDDDPLDDAAFAKLQSKYNNKKKKKWWSRCHKQQYSSERWGFQCGFVTRIHS
jgi:hypothetical protein